MGSTEVKDTEAQIETTEMLVPVPGAGSFVSNEHWASFPGTHAPDGLEYWVENGQIAGDVTGSERALKWFWAVNNANGLYYYPEGWPEEGWIFHIYSVQSQLNGNWCVYVDGGWAGCPRALPPYSRRLVVGSELATPWPPMNTMNEQVSYTGKNGSTQPWLYAQRNISAEHYCLTHFSRESPPHEYPGNSSMWGYYPESC